MSSFISKLRINYKSILFLLLISLIPIIGLAISIIWIDNNGLKASLDAPIQTLTCNQLARIDEKTLSINNMLGQVADSLKAGDLNNLSRNLESSKLQEIEKIIDQNQYGTLLGLDIILEGLDPIHFGQSNITLENNWVSEWRQIDEDSQVFWYSEDNSVFAVKTVDEKGSRVLLVANLPLNFYRVIFKDLPADFGYQLFNEQNQSLIQFPSPKGDFPTENYMMRLPSQGKIDSTNLQATYCTNAADWRLFIISPLNYSVANNNLLFKILLVVILAITLFILIFAILMNQKLIQPVKDIAFRLKQLNHQDKPDFERIPENPYTGEVGDLVTEFNQFIQNQKITQERSSILDEKRERFELALQGSKIGLWDWNLKNNHCYYSPTWRNILGHTEESIHNLPTEWFTRVHPEDIESLRTEINNHIAGKTPIFEKEHRIRHMNDTYIWVLARGLARKGEDGVPNRFVGTIENITQRKSLEARLMIEAMYDPLTGLPNRTYFSGIIEQSLGRIRRREDYHSAVLFIDLDRFKSINDNYSFSIGDAVLLEITRRLKYSLRSMDTISRFGNDKFGVLLEEINGLPDTIKITRRIHKEINKPFNFSGEIIQPTTSIGIVMLSRGYQDSNEVLRDAESAMFQAKSDGRGKFEIYDKEIYSYTLSRIRIENELKQALKNKEISLCYQPIIDTETNHVIFADAISIWQHPEKGFIPKDHYLSVAEDSGEIIPLNHFLLRKACSEASEWFSKESSGTLLSVPISPKMILKSEFTETVLSTMADSNLPNESLQLVISESSKIYNSGIAIQAMVNLSSIGVKFCLADYGVIPSSLEQLKRLPIHAIRISETLTKDLPTNEEDAVITESIFSLAKILGLQVIVTGVDTKEQMDFLTQKGIHLISGDFVSQPLMKTEFINFLTRRL
ncbi:MAG: EAL domain-containing protein [Anaerolineaceae bacterium]|nr:EAL domain-containing protein [Anaerolineaceae bacterium]